MSSCSHFIPMHWKTGTCLPSSPLSHWCSWEHLPVSWPRKLGHQVTSHHHHWLRDYPAQSLGSEIPVWIINQWHSSFSAGPVSSLRLRQDIRKWHVPSSSASCPVWYSPSLWRGLVCTSQPRESPADWWESDCCRGWWMSTGCIRNCLRSRLQKKTTTRA